MIRRLFIISLLIIAIPAICLAADQSRAAAVGGNVDQVVAIGDASSGYLAEVSSTSGALNVAGRAQAISSRWGDGQLYTGACRLLGVHIEGASAADSAAIYDGTSTAGTYLGDPQISTNTRSEFIPFYGAPVATGIYADCTDTDVHVTAIYDY
jgi:hypothetical protein